MYVVELKTLFVRIHLKEKTITKGNLYIKKKMVLFSRNHTAYRRECNN